MGVTFSRGRQNNRSYSKREYSPLTVQKKQLQQILSPSEAVAIEGYIQDKEGVLKTAKQAVQQLLVDGEKMHMCASIKQWLYYSYDDGTDSFIKRYDGTTDELIHTYTGSTDKVFIKAFDEYLFACQSGRLGFHNYRYKIAEYSTTSGNFVLGQALTGSTSGNIVIPKKEESGIFTYSVQTGELTDGEEITDGAGFVGTYTQSVNFKEIDGSPENCLFFDFYQSYQGGGEFLVTSSDGRVMWSESNSDIGKIPFYNWSQTLPPLPFGAFEKVFNKGGEHKTLTAIGSDFFLGAEKDDMMMRINTIVVGTGTQQDNQVTHQGGKGAVSSFAVDNNLFYVSGKEWWRGAVYEGGLQIDHEPLTAVFAQDDKDDFNFDESFHFYDRSSSIVYLVFKRRSSKNNYMLGYNIKDGSIKEYPNTYLNDVIEHQGELWGVGSLTTNLVKVFGGYQNNGDAVRTRILSRKVTGNARETLHIDHINIEGLLEGLVEVRVYIHTWNKDGTLTKKAYEASWSSQTGGSAVGIGSLGIGDVPSQPKTDIITTNLAWDDVHLKNVYAYQVEMVTIGFSSHELHNQSITYRAGDLQLRGKHIS